jgi:hypothetical protein
MRKRAMRLVETVQTVLYPLTEGLDADDYVGEFESVLSDIKDDDPRLLKKAAEIISKNLGLRVNFDRDDISDIAGDMVNSDPRDWQRTLDQLERLL